MLYFMINLLGKREVIIMNKKVRKVVTWIILLVMVAGIIASITAYAFQ